MSRAASELLSRSLSGALDGPVIPAISLRRVEAAWGPRPASAPGESTERAAALAAGATRTITGYWENAGSQLRLTVVEDDLVAGKTLSQFSAQGRIATGVIRDLAGTLARGKARVAAANEDAVRLYASALETPDAGPLLEKAIQTDPKLGPAWIALVSWSAGKNGRASALEILERSRKADLNDSDRASLDLEAANLSGDPMAQLSALRRLASLETGDLDMLRGLAEREMAAGAYSNASSVWNRIAQSVPAEPENWNNLGYARAYAGDRNGALAAMQQYVKLKPNEANPLDSLGDIDYLFRNFKEAATNYVAANANHPAPDAGELYKAAWAQYQAGDKRAGDASFDQFRAEQERRRNPSLPLLQADYLYRTGRAPDGRAVLERAIGSSEGLGKSLFAAQLAIWYVLDGQREKAYRTITSVDLVRNPAVISAFFIARPSGPVSEWKALADRMLPLPGAGTLHDTALAYALMTDGHRDEALQLWSRLMQLNTSPDFFGRAIQTRLRGQPLQQPLIPNSSQYNEFSAILDRL